MKAMILSAGEGTRLRPLTDSVPKVMIKIGGKPLLEHNINLAHRYNVNEVIINVHYKSDSIINYFGSGTKHGIAIYYSKEKNLLGSAGGVKKVAKKLTKPFFLLYGDNYTNCNLDKLLAAHKKNKTICSVAIFDMNKNKNSGIAGGRVLLNKDKTIKQFVEKGAAISNLVNAGVYVLDPKIFSYIPLGKMYDFGKDLFPEFLKRQIKIGSYQMPKSEYVFGCDTIACYNKAQDFFEINKNKI